MKKVQKATNKVVDISPKVWYVLWLPKGGHNTMRDYMTVLQDRFRITSEKSDELAGKVESAYDALHAELSREQQKLLLRYLDAENAFREGRELDSFISGFRLADGIRGELSMIPTFSIVKEDEEQARKIFEKEWGEQNGETPGER